MRLTFGTLLLVGALGLGQGGGAQGQPPREEAGLVGYVLAPDGAPVSAGSVELRNQNRVTAAIEPTGRFHLVPNSIGMHDLHIVVRGLAPHRIKVSVPPSRTLKLPVVRLSPPTHFRVKPFAPTGEPITAPRLLRRSVDITGAAVAGFADQNVETTIDAEGAITIGPLPRGVTTLALESPPLATARLPDLYITGADPVLDGGTVSIGPGTTLQVDVVTAAGAAVPAHDVFLDDSRPLSPMPFQKLRTNAKGRATFERLARGPYRVRTFAAGRCGMPTLMIARVVPVPGSGTLAVRIVADGRATLRLNSPFGPLIGTQVSMNPDPAEIPPNPGLRMTTDSAMQQRLSAGMYVSAPPVPRHD